MDDFDIREDLEKVQPDPIDIMGTISPEEVDNVSEVPRGVCSGTLLPETSTTTATPTSTQGNHDQHVGAIIEIFSLQESPVPRTPRRLLKSRKGKATVLVQTMETNTGPI